MLVFRAKSRFSGDSGRLIEDFFHSCDDSDCSICFETCSETKSDEEQDRTDEKIVLAQKILFWFVFKHLLRNCKISRMDVIGIMK